MPCPLWPSACGTPESNPSTDSFNCLCGAEFQVSPCRLTGNPKLTSQLSLGPHSHMMTSRLSGNVTRCTNSGADWHGVWMWWLCYCAEDTKDLLLKFEVSHVPLGKRTSVLLPCVRSHPQPVLGQFGFHVSGVFFENPITYTVSIIFFYFK